MWVTTHDDTPESATRSCWNLYLLEGFVWVSSEVLLCCDKTSLIFSILLVFLESFPRLSHMGISSLALDLDGIYSWMVCSWSMESIVRVWPSHMCPCRRSRKKMWCHRFRRKSVKSPRCAAGGLAIYIYMCIYIGYQNFRIYSGGKFIPQLQNWADMNTDAHMHMHIRTIVIYVIKLQCRTWIVTTEWHIVNKLL